MIRYFMAKDLTDKDKADFQKFIDFSVQSGTLEQKVDVTKYLQGLLSAGALRCDRALLQPQAQPRTLAARVCRQRSRHHPGALQAVR